METFGKDKTFETLHGDFFWVLLCSTFIVTCTFDSLVKTDYTDLQKKFPGINFQDSIRFSAAEYEYESRFFPSRPDFPKFYDKGLKINKIGCL